MADDFLSSLGAGLRGAGAILSDDVWRAQRQDESQMNQFRMQQQRAQQDLLYKAVISGAMTPEAASAAGLRVSGLGPGVAEQKVLRDARMNEGVRTVMAPFMEKGDIKGGLNAAIMAYPEWAHTGNIQGMDALRKMNEPPVPDKISPGQGIADPSVPGGYRVPIPAADKAEKQSPVATLIAERDALPSGDPNRKIYDNAIRKASETAAQIVPRVNVTVGGAPAASVSTLSGDEFLKSLPPGQGNLIKGIAEGRIPLTNFSTKGGHREQLSQMAMQYDPTFNTQRSAVLRDFTAGKSAANVTAINTAIGHLDSLDALGTALKNNNSQDINRLVNNISSRLGKPEVNNYDLARGAVGDELMRVFRQVGASQQEADAWKARFDSANSPDKIKGSVKTAGELLRSRINAIDDQYKRGMGTEQGFPNLLSPKSAEVMARISGKPPQRRESDQPSAIRSQADAILKQK